MFKIVSKQNINTQKTDYYINHSEDLCLSCYLRNSTVFFMALELALVGISLILAYPLSSINIENTTTTIIDNIYNTQLMCGVILSTAIIDTFKKIEHFALQCFSFKITYTQIIYHWLWSIPLSAFQLYGYAFIGTNPSSLHTTCLLIYAIYGSIKLLIFIITGLVYLCRYIHIRIVLCNKISAESGISKIKNENKIIKDENKIIKDELNKLKKEHIALPIVSKINDIDNVDNLK